MKLLLRRDQRPASFGAKPVFMLDVRADISDEERRDIEKYKLGETVLYTNLEIVDKGSGLLGLASRLAYKAMSITVTVKDLTNGKKIECKDIVQMVAVEGQVREAAQTFMDILRAAAQFGGEEVVEI